MTFFQKPGDGVAPATKDSLSQSPISLILQFYFIFMYWMEKEFRFLDYVMLGIS